MRRKTVSPALVFLSLGLICATNASAHVSEQGLVLLLPTDIYIASGCAAVIASIVVVSLVPHGWVHSMFGSFVLTDILSRSASQKYRLSTMTSLLSLACIIGLVFVGVLGTRDPLSNLLPLMIWTVWWIAIVMLHVVFGNVWHLINPWVGMHVLVYGKLDQPPLLPLPKNIGHWPAIPIFISFIAFSIAHPAPDDPARLANFVLGYVLFTFVGMTVFGGKRWLESFECFTLFFRFAGALAPVQRTPNGNHITIGLPGWRILESPTVPYSTACFVLVLLASGSFDGVNETFWWLAQIGVNPLEFPGRSAVILESTLGLIGANILLLGLFSACIWTSLKLATQFGEASKSPDFKYAFCSLSLSVLPIAFAYHGSHYLISFMVNGQYVVAALSDPLAQGANYLNLQNYQVTTGFLNTPESVKTIWLSQAAIIVTGHILAVLMAHNTIAKIYSSKRDALICHIPMGMFMAAYTWFGLWLLAAPRGA